MAFKNTPAQDYVFSNHTNLLKANASSQEQKFIENLVVESIEIYGQDIYYVPRTLVNRDTVFGEDSDSQFDSARAIRAMSIMQKDGRAKVSYLANLESASKIRRRLFSPVKSLKKKLTIWKSSMSKDDQTKGI